MTSSRLLPLALAVLCACGHAAPVPAPPAGPPPAPAPDPRQEAEAISQELRAVLRAEGELVWRRWITGQGALPASAAEGHEHLWSRATLDVLERAAAASSDPAQRRAFARLRVQLFPQAIARTAGAAVDAAERARAAVAFAASGDARPEHAEGDLERLLIDEPSAARRAAIAEAEARAAAGLAASCLLREQAEEQAVAQLGLPGGGALVEALHGTSLQELAGLAERTLAATDELAARAVARASQANLGLPADRVRRADLPRLVRTSLADAELKEGRAWALARAALAGAGADPLALAQEAGAPGRLLVDAEGTPVKGARPLALLVDPPLDVRLSVRPAGGLDELRALLHESARAAAGALTRTARWEEAQLGDGTAALGTAALFAGLAGDPEWLRESTALRGEPLDDVVHTEAARRLLAVRRAAALVLFEAGRRPGPGVGGAVPPAPAQEETAALFARLLERATRAKHSALDGARWPLEADAWVRSALALRAALLAPALEAALPPAWWRSAEAGPLLRSVWALGRAGTAEQAAALVRAPLDPAPLAQLLERRLAYQAPERPPAAPKPDYKQLQGDRRPRKKAKKLKK